MKINRIDYAMNIPEIISAISDGDPDACECIEEILKANHSGFMNLVLLDALQIYGKELAKLWIFCCQRNSKKLKKTLWFFHRELFTEEQIHENLAKDEPEPFVT